jgi:hypothetical protein
MSGGDVTIFGSQVSGARPKWGPVVMPCLVWP